MLLHGAVARSEAVLLAPSRSCEAAEELRHASSLKVLGWVRFTIASAVAPTKIRTSTERICDRGDHCLQLDCSQGFEPQATCRAVRLRAPCSCCRPGVGQPASP